MNWYYYVAFGLIGLLLVVFLLNQMKIIKVDLLAPKNKIMKDFGFLKRKPDGIHGIGEEWEEYEMRGGEQRLVRKKYVSRKGKIKLEKNVVDTKERRLKSYKINTDLKFKDTLGQILGTEPKRSMEEKFRIKVMKSYKKKLGRDLRPNEIGIIESIDDSDIEDFRNKRITISEITDNEISDLPEFAFMVSNPQAYMRDQEEKQKRANDLARRKREKAEADRNKVKTRKLNL